MGQGSMYLWAVAGVYLIFLGAKQFIALIDGSASMPWLNAAAGVLFLAVGGAVLLREWRAYRRLNTKKPEEAEGPEETEEDAEGVEEE